MKNLFVRRSLPAPSNTAPAAPPLLTPAKSKSACAAAAHAAQQHAATSRAAKPRLRLPALALAASALAGAARPLLLRPNGPPNVMHAPHLVWGARTHVVRAQTLDAGALEALLAALSPHQFAFIRDNVFVPPQLQLLHARLWARPRPQAALLSPLLENLTRGGRTDKLSYLFAFFHLSAGSRAGADNGAWCSVASPRDARTLARLAAALAPGATPAPSARDVLLPAPTTAT